MRRRNSSPLDEHRRLPRNPDLVLDKREMEEKEERRRKWMLEQEKMRQHERLKRKMIEEYERKRKEERESRMRNRRRSPHRSESRHSSLSPTTRRRDEAETSTSRNAIMSQKVESSGNNEKLFKGPEGSKINTAELHRIKVNIHRTISNTETNNEIHRDIVVPEEVKVKRREGEGLKPIFERLKQTEVPTLAVEERRTVVAIDNTKIENKPSTSRKRSVTPETSSRRSSSKRRTEERESRYESSRHNEDRLRGHSRHERESERHQDRSRESRTRHHDDDLSEHSRRRSRDVSRDHRDRRKRSSSADRESRRTESRNRSSREILPYRERRERSREDSRDRRHRDDRSRESRIHMPSHHYADAIPIPMYYEGFHPRPIMVGPMMPIRGQIPLGRGRMPPIMGPIRPYPPRFLPPEMFRPTMHPNPRFGRMF